jgi:hypothetical protein
MQSDLAPSPFGFIRCRVLNLTSTGGLAWIQLTNSVKPNFSRPAYLTTRRKNTILLNNPIYLRYDVGSTYTIECWYKPAKSDGEVMVLNERGRMGICQ